MIFRTFTLASIVAGVSILLLGCGGGASTPSNPPTAANAAAAPAIAAGAPTLLSWSNGEQIPASFANANFGASGPLYQQLPASPQLDPNSASDISYYFAGNAPAFQVGWVDAGPNQAQYDYSNPLYIAAATDPLVTIFCNKLSLVKCADGGVQIRMPALALQAGGTDHSLAVLEPNGLEYDFWLVSSNPPYSNGSSFSAASEGHYSSAGSDYGANFVAPGFDVSAATASGIALSGTQIYASELTAGVINRAIDLLFPCGTTTWVYPASQATGVCANGAGMPLGSRVWWQPADAQTNAMPLPRDIKTVLVAFHHYGAFFSNGGSVTSNGQGVGTSAHLENQEPYWLYGNRVDPALLYAQSAQGWLHLTTAAGVNRYLLSAAGSSVDFLDNLKVLAPCVTQKTC